jgi:hypothetical protein
MHSVAKCIILCTAYLLMFNRMYAATAKSDMSLMSIVQVFDVVMSSFSSIAKVP